jgi:hypothetical protein
LFGVSDLTRSPDIKLNARVSLRRLYGWQMKKRQLHPARPKEIIVRVSKKPAETIYQQYADILRLRDEITRFADSGTKSRQKVGRS